MIVAYSGGVSTRGETSLFTLLMFLIAYAMVARFAGDPMQCVRVRRARPLLLICSVLASLAIIPPAVSLQALVFSRVEIPAKWMEYVLEVVRAESVPELIYAWLVVALGAAVSEEFVFRGVFQNALSNRLGGWAAVLVTSTVFAALHTWRFPAAFVMGFFLGALYLRTRSILVPFAAHLTINSVVVLMQYAIDKKGEDIFPGWLVEDNMAPFLLIVISGLIFVLLMLLIFHLTRTEAARPWSDAGDSR
ncbi:lysostaphin resistance A-like protein [Candidatus Eisenbacteria bacterium]|uniref:Lysostaphin resistance A-like protein n=1 Tax=Eiseniibacteriota bacterium TaxID=2212470 RepID=A0ABV6YN23_UNCEI